MVLSRVAAVGLLVPGLASAYTRPFSAVATMSVYPGYTDGGYYPNGTIAVTETDTGILLKGVMVGLPPSTTAGFHIHEGVSCDNADDPGGHYFEGLDSDPWDSSTTIYTSDSNGVAAIELEVEGFSLNMDSPVAGRVIVVHDTSTRIGCGVLSSTAGEVVHLGNYPIDGVGTPTDGNGYNATGTLVVLQTNSGITIQGLIAGLEASVSAGIHIHSGYTCDDADGVGGHYWEDSTGPWGDVDPWSTTYTSDANGFAKVDMEMEYFSLDMTYPVAYRTLVVHSSSAKIGCGIIGNPSLAIAELDVYPGYTGEYYVNGTVAVTETDSGVVIEGTVVGLPPSSSAGFHIHSGVSCADASAPGGHYFDGLDVDPWCSDTDGTCTTIYKADANGVASVSMNVSKFSFTGDHPVAGRVFVVHGDGTRIGCGVISPTTGEVVQFERYPSYSASGLNMSGTVLVEATDVGIDIRGTLGGLESQVTSGFHIHSGYTCADADGVGGHYDDGLEVDPWDTTYSSDAKGVAKIDFSMKNFSLSMTRPAFGRTMVVHGDGTKIGCGIIGKPTVGVAHIRKMHSFDNSYTPNGTVAVIETDEGIMIKGTIVGLPPNAEHGFHIHSGVNCDDFGNHFWPWQGHLDDDGSSSDPWTGLKYDSDENGVASFSAPMLGFTMTDAYPVAGRVLIVHGPQSAGSKKIACGIIESTAGEVVYMKRYPGYSGNGLNVSGTVHVEQIGSGITMRGTLGGLEASTTAGFHIHSGSTCDDADGVGGHYWDESGDGPWGSTDPWTTNYVSDANGYAEVNMVMSHFSLDMSYPTAYKTMVVHASTSGVKTACGTVSNEGVPTQAVTLVPSPVPTMSPAPTTSAPSPVPTVSPVPTGTPTPEPSTSDDGDDDEDGGAKMKKPPFIFIMGFGGLLLFGVFLFACSVCCCKKKPDDMDEAGVEMDDVETAPAIDRSTRPSLEHFAAKAGNSDRQMV